MIYRAFLLAVRRSLHRGRLFFVAHALDRDSVLFRVFDLRSHSDRRRVGVHINDVALFQPLQSSGQPVLAFVCVQIVEKLRIIELRRDRFESRLIQGTAAVLCQ